MVRERKKKSGDTRRRLRAHRARTPSADERGRATQEIVGHALVELLKRLSKLGGRERRVLDQHLLPSPDDAIGTRTTIPLPPASVVSLAKKTCGGRWRPSWSRGRTMASTHACTVCSGLARLLSAATKRLCAGESTYAAHAPPAAARPVAVFSARQYGYRRERLPCTHQGQQRLHAPPLGRAFRSCGKAELPFDDPQRVSHCLRVVPCDLS